MHWGPMVGNRVFHSLACLDKTMVAIWGPEGVNVEKMAEEGGPSGCQLLWGLYMDFDRKVISLPEPKRMKAKYLLAEPALCRGHKEVPLRLLQGVAGCAQYWSLVCPELLPRLPKMDPSFGYPYVPYISPISPLKGTPNFGNSPGIRESFRMLFGSCDSRYLERGDFGDV